MDWQFDLKRDVGELSVRWRTSMYTEREVDNGRPSYITDGGKRWEIILKKKSSV